MLERPSEEASAAAPQSYSGVVKMWNAAKGYGFLTSDGIPGDIFFSKQELAMDLQQVQALHPKFLGGREMYFQLSSGPDGRHKASALQLVPTEGQPVAGIVKSFNEERRYGFITSSSLTGDVRFDHKEVPPGVSGSMLKDQPALFKVHQLPDGKLRASQVQFLSVAAAPPPQAMPPMQPPIQGGHGGTTIDLHGVLSQFGVNAAALNLPTYVELISTPPRPGHLGGGKGAPGAGIKRPASSMSMSPVPFGGAGNGFGASPPPQKMMRSAPPGPKTQGVGTSTGQYGRGQIKSFNSSKGFGFIQSSTMEGDVFFLRSSLRSQVPEDQLAGQSCSFELCQGADGRLRGDNVTID